MDLAYSYILNDLKLKYGDTVVAGISGGPDSMALLHLLVKIKKVLDIEIVCAHVNHNLREESKDELQFVKRYCTRNNVIFELLEIDNYEKYNIESQARVKRYEFFEKLIKKYNSKILFTAHHGDDLMETILMRIVRGSTLKGYSGFQKVTNKRGYKIVRPLIDVTKEEIMNYLKSNRLKYAIDNTNFTDEHTRNRYRKYVLPQLKKEDIKVHEKFLKFSNTLQEYSDYVDRQVSKVIDKVYPQHVLNIPLFLHEDHLIQTRIVYKMLEDVYQDDILLVTNLHATLIYNLIKSRKSQTYIYLPNNIKAIKTYDTFTLVKEKKLDLDYEYKLSDFINLPNGKNLQLVSNSNETDNFICRLDSGEINLPLKVRNKREGDKMQIKGMLGRKKIGDIFTDCKIKNDDRMVWPIVLDSNDNIVWLPGLRKSKFDKQKDEKYDIIIKYY